MKTLILLILVGLIFISGCSDENNMFTPVKTYSSGPAWITLPQKSNTSVETEYTVTGFIDGTAGGILVINQVYIGGPLGNVKANVRLKFPQNCFPGTETITMVVDNVNGTMTYLPSMNFVVPATLDLEFVGLDLTGINPNDINFVYHHPDGYYDNMEYKNLTVNLAGGMISLKDGKIPHFSRYGFSR